MEDGSVSVAVDTGCWVISNIIACSLSLDTSVHPTTSPCGCPWCNETTRTFRRLLCNSSSSRCKRHFPRQTHRSSPSDHHFNPVGLEVPRSFREQDMMFLRRNPELIVATGIDRVTVLELLLAQRLQVIGVAGSTDWTAVQTFVVKQAKVGSSTC